MKWCKSFFFVFCFVFASSGFAEPPKLDDLKKLMLFLQKEIFGKGKYGAWRKWAKNNSYVFSAEENFSWSDYICPLWSFTEDTLTLEWCNEALQLFRRKQGIERRDQDELSFVCEQEMLTALLDDVGVRAKISHIADDVAKDDLAIIPGDALSRIESSINCLCELYNNKHVEKFIMAGADLVLSTVDNEDKLLSEMPIHKAWQISYDLVEKDIKTEMDGMFFMAMLMLKPDFDFDFDFDFRLSKDAAGWKNKVLLDVVYNGLRNKSCLSVSNMPANSNIPANKITMKISYAQGCDGNRATTKDNVTAICNDNLDIVVGKLALLSTQPHAHYQEEIFKKKFNKVKNMEDVDITVFAQPVDDRILLIEKLNALHQWLQESLSSS
ncbi:MAG: hypothetical protein QS721_07060 [Candidatus Endonucleobacter sp. (ex Gigantidas childressi)]|nr:hypothetical protein [Candidatus Endonucleobacter sp. (ex Gigantidas childressi)]